MKKAHIDLKQILLCFVLMIYIFILAKVLLFKYVSPLELFQHDRAFSRTLNILPIISILEYFGSAALKVALMNVVGNIVIFIPAGIYLQLLKSNKKVMQSIFILFAISLSVEITQFIFGIGASDIDDILLNTFGGIIGIALYRIAALLLKEERRIKTAITIFSCVAAALSAVFVIRYYPQVLGIQKSYELVIKGKAFAVDDKNPDVVGEFIGFHNGILTVRNITGIANRQDQYGDVEISVIVDPDLKMAKKAIDYTYSPDEILVTYSKFTMDQFDSLGRGDGVSFNLIEEDGQRMARDICVTYAKDIIK